jgi:NAD(P)-dependent dehydrogenase (short-subunit alcohol dehydrogenase family)
MSKTIVITGASDGIGAAAAAQLAASGHRVVVVGRSPEKTRKVAETIGADHFVTDFAELAQVRTLAAQLLAAYPRIDVLANNAGGQMGARTVTADGHEKTFQVNHLAPFLLTNLLMEVLVDSRASVVNTSSIGSKLYGHVNLDDLDSERWYEASRAYCTSKLENVLFTNELHRRFHDQGVSTLAFHPGVIASNFASDATNMMGLLYRTPLRNLLTSSQTAGGFLARFAAGTPGRDWVSGEYYEKTKLAKPARQATDADLARALWERSETLVAASAGPTRPSPSAPGPQ